MNNELFACEIKQKFKVVINFITNMPKLKKNKNERKIKLKLKIKNCQK